MAVYLEVSTTMAAMEVEAWLLPAMAREHLGIDNLGSSLVTGHTRLCVDELAYYINRLAASCSCASVGTVVIVCVRL